MKKNNLLVTGGVLAIGALALGTGFIIADGLNAQASENDENDKLVIIDFEPEIEHGDVYESLEDFLAGLDEVNREFQYHDGHDMEFSRHETGDRRVDLWEYSGEDQAGFVSQETVVDGISLEEADQLEVDFDELFEGFGTPDSLFDELN